MRSPVGSPAPSASCRTGRYSQHRIRRAFARQPCQQRHDPDQLGIVPKSGALIHKEPDKQRRAYDHANHAINIAFIGGEHVRVLFAQVPQNWAPGITLNCGSKSDIDLEQTLAIRPKPADPARRNPSVFGHIAAELRGQLRAFQHLKPRLRPSQRSANRQSVIGTQNLKNWLQKILKCIPINPLPPITRVLRRR